MCENILFEPYTLTGSCRNKLKKDERVIDIIEQLAEISFHSMCLSPAIITLLNGLLAPWFMNHNMSVRALNVE